MTIDPTDFEAQGQPTREQARAVWDAMAKPSARKVTNELVNRGFDVSFRTIARWKARDWRGKDSPGSRPLAEKGTVRGISAALKDEIAKIPDKTVAGADRMAGGDPGLTLDDYVLIARRRAELMLLSEAELDSLEAKSRKIMNILIAEEAARRAHLMVLIPKDTGSLVGALSEAQKVALTGGMGQAPASSDAKVINGSALREEPDNPLASAIGKFLADIEAV